MTGAIIGDIVGSIHEFDHRFHGKKDAFDIFQPDGSFMPGTFPTDDSLCTIAIASAIYATRKYGTELRDNVVDFLVDFGLRFPHSGYGTMYFEWLESKDHKPYGSWGNGAAMRVSPCAFLASSRDEAAEFSDIATGVTHNHEEGMAWAKAVTLACWDLAHGASKESVVTLMPERDTFAKPFSEIVNASRFTCRSRISVRDAVHAFLVSTSFEDAIRNAIALGADADTQACIAGALAEAHYGVPERFKVAAARKFREFSDGENREFTAFWLKTAVGFDIYAYD